jgi:hypothetical protein
LLTKDTLEICTPRLDARNALHSTFAAGCGRPLLYTLVGRAKQLNPPITQNPIAHIAEPKWAGGKLERIGE